MRIPPQPIEPTVLLCPGCGYKKVAFVPVRDPQTRALEYTPHHCVCGYRIDLHKLPAGELFGLPGDVMYFRSLQEGLEI